jgi:hypothetical protein
VVDCGPPDYHDGDDYPPYVMRAAAASASASADFSSKPA